MNKIQLIKNFLNSSYNGEDGDIWQLISSLNCSELICMDVDMTFIGNNDDLWHSLNIDFSGEKNVLSLFFCGSSDYFPGIWIGNDDIEMLDKMPIYIFDLSDSSEEPCECVGNFRQYIEKLLDDFLKVYKTNDEYLKTAIRMKEDVKQFSLEVVDKGNIIIKSFD